MSQVGADEDDVPMRTMAFSQECDDIYLAHVIHNDLDGIIRDIRTSHEADNTTADEGTVPDMNALEMLVGSAVGGAPKEDLDMQVMGMIGVPEKKQNAEDAEALLEIAAKSEHVINQKRMRGKARPAPKAGEETDEDVCYPFEQYAKSGGRPNKSVAALASIKVAAQAQHLCQPQRSASMQNAAHALQRYNTLHFQTESRVQTGRSHPYWMTQRKGGRAAFGSVSCGEPRFFCRSAHPDVRLVSACGLVRHAHHHQPFFHGWANIQFPQVFLGF